MKKYLLYALAALFSALPQAFADTQATSVIQVNLSNFPSVVCVDSHPTSSSCSFAGSDNVAAVSGTATALASYGTLRAFTSASYVGPTPGGGRSIQTFANSSFQDFFTFTGIQGTALLSITSFLHGSLTGTSSAELDVQFGGQECVLTTSGSCTIALNVSNQSQVGLFEILLLSSFADDTRPSGFADYTHTAGVFAVQLFDANGNPLPESDIISASGTVYPNGSQVPEPGSLALVLCGIGAIAISKSCKLI